MLLKEYGFGDIYIGDTKYRIAPTFANIANIGDTAKDRVDAFNSFVTESNLVWRYFKALDILNYCCEPKLPESITGTLRYSNSKAKIANPPPSYFIHDVMMWAEHCLKHAIIGPTEQGAKTGNPMTEFDPYEYIELACEHLGKSTDEAANMTMTQFVRAMRVKFPELNNAKKKQGFTDEELDWHKKMMKLDEERAAKAALKNATKA